MEMTIMNMQTMRTVGSLSRFINDPVFDVVSNSEKNKILLMSLLTIKLYKKLNLRFPSFVITMKKKLL